MDQSQPYAPQAPSYAPQPGTPTAPVMSLGQWLVCLLLMLIPLVNVILLIVWALDGAGNPNRKHWAAAQLIFMVIGTVLYFVLMAAFGAALMGLAGNLGS